MTVRHAWETIIGKLNGTRMEFPTVPKRQKTPVWFSASTDGNIIFISNAEENRPSSKITIPRKLTYETFQKIYPLYERRENGEPVSQEATAITVNQVYYYSLIKHLCDYK